MADQDAALTIKINADSSQATSAFGKLKDDTESLKGGFGGLTQANAMFFGGAVAGWETVIKLAGDAIKGIGEMIKGAEDEEQAMLLLKVAMENASDGTQDLFNQVKGLSEQYAVMSGKPLEDVEEGYSKLIKTTGSVKTAISAMQPVLDMAISQNMSVSQAAQLVGRAYEKGGNLLSRYGIIIDAHAKGMEVLNAIESKFGGTMEANSETTKNYGERSGVAWKEFGDTVGGALLNSIKRFQEFSATIAESLTSIFKAAQQNDFFKWFGAAISHLINVDIPMAAKIFTEVLPSIIKGGIAKGTAAWLDESNKMEADYSAHNEKMKKEATDMQAFRKKTGDIAPSETDAKEETTILMDLSAQTKAIYEKNGVDIVALEDKKRTELYAEAVATEKDRSKADENFTKNWNKWVVGQNNMELKAAEAQAKKVLDIEQKKIERFLEMKAKFGEAYATLDSNLHSEEVTAFQSGMQELSQLSNSKNKTLFDVGKAVSMAMIPVQTAQSAMSVFSGMVTAIPGPVGLALGTTGAAAAVLYGAERLTEVAGQNFQPASAANGIFPSGGINGEPYITTLDRNEGIMPQSMTTALQKNQITISGPQGSGGGTHVHFHGDIYGVPKDEFYKKSAQKFNEQIQSGKIKSGNFTGATS